ncbi:MAG TPA: hypothetical protein VFW62_01065 [bacterium]|nr:hypothetical protein [bacterium]
MAKTQFSGLPAASPRAQLKKRRRKFRDPRLRWMDELLRSFHGPAPESWLPGSYRYLYRQLPKLKRPAH